MGAKKILPSNTPMLVLKLLEEKEKYGWEIIEELAEKSFNMFRLQTGALYPVLHNLEHDGYVTASSRTIENGRVRKYYRITSRGKEHLAAKHAEWESYSKAVESIMGTSKYSESSDSLGFFRLARRRIESYTERMAIDDNDARRKKASEDGGEWVFRGALEG